MLKHECLGHAIVQPRLMASVEGTATLGQIWEIELEMHPPRLQNPPLHCRVKLEELNHANLYRPCPLDSPNPKNGKIMVLGHPKTYAKQVVKKWSPPKGSRPKRNPNSAQYFHGAPRGLFWIGLGSSWAGSLLAVTIF